MFKGECENCIHHTITYCVVTDRPELDCLMGEDVYQCCKCKSKEEEQQN